jgi:hypothetical protein
MFTRNVIYLVDYAHINTKQTGRNYGRRIACVFLEVAVIGEIKLLRGQVQR